MTYGSAAYSKIAIETPENISIEYELAGPGSRMTAYLVDFIFLIAGTASLGWLLTVLSDISGFFENEQNTIWIAVSTVFYALGGYFIIFEWLMNGQTPGKKALGIRVRMTEGTPATLQAIVIRNLFRIADCAFPFQYAAGCLMIVFSSKTQRAGDLAAGTIVVKEEGSQKAGKFTWSPKLGRGMKTPIAQLSREEFDYLMEYIHIHTKLPKKDRSRIALKFLAPLLEKYPLDKNPQTGPLIVEMNSMKPDQKYMKAEMVMREILNPYLAE